MSHLLYYKIEQCLSLAGGGVKECATTMSWSWRDVSVLMGNRAVLIMIKLLSFN